MGILYYGDSLAFSCNNILNIITKNGCLFKAESKAKC